MDACVEHRWIFASQDKYETRAASALSSQCAVTSGSNQPPLSRLAPANFGGWLLTVDGCNSTNFMCPELTIQYQFHVP
jgi:hypothetical protein